MDLVCLPGSIDQVTSGAIIRVVCHDGPCRGPQYMDVDSGRILYSEIPEAATVVYRIEGQPGYIHTNIPPAPHVDNRDCNATPPHGTRRAL